MADKLCYLGSVTLTPYHTQSMLPWVLAEIQTKSAEAGAKLECGFSFDETTLRLFSDDDHSLVLSHPILSISRFVHPRLSLTQSSLPTFAYLEKESSPTSNHNSYKIHAFQCFDRSQVSFQYHLRHSVSYLKKAIKLKLNKTAGYHQRFFRPPILLKMPSRRIKVVFFRRHALSSATILTFPNLKFFWFIAKR